jgi:hypothetical protein
MSLGKILVLLLGLAAVAFSVKFALSGTFSQSDPTAESRPKRQLDNVRSKARDLEVQQQKAADDLANKASEK